MTDPIADMLTRIRNAMALKREEVSIPFSDLKFKILKIMEREGFLKKVDRRGRRRRKEIRVFLSYEDDFPSIHELKRISKPGQRIYASKGEIKPVRNGYGIAIISTSKGLMSDREARKAGLGGEVLCSIW